MFCLLAAGICHAQGDHSVSVSTPVTAPASNPYEDDPAADPSRPTVTNPAHIPPPGYLQFEQGFLQANTTPNGPDRQFSLNQATKVSLNHHVMVFLLSEPFTRSVTGHVVSHDPGDLDLGVQFVLSDQNEGHGRKPTIAVSYINRVRSGTSASLDVGSYNRSTLLLAAGDLFGIHYDTNFIVNEQPGSTPNLPNHAPPRRAQLGQTLAITRNLTPRFSISGEIWHFSLPLAGGNALGNLYAVGYTPVKTIVIDAGFSRGLTGQSTHWETFAGFSYLLPHRLWPKHKK